MCLVGAEKTSERERRDGDAGEKEITREGGAGCCRSPATRRRPEVRLPVVVAGGGG